MIERVVKLQEKLAPNPSVLAVDQAISRPNAKYGLLRSPAATHLPPRKNQSHAIFDLIGTDDANNVPPGSHDPEKEKESYNQPSHLFRSPACQHSRVIYDDHEDDGDDDGPKEHAGWILIYLSALSPLLALPIAFYTLLMATLLLLLYPLCLCLKQCPIGARFRHFLSPLLVFQLGLVYSSYDIDDSVHSKASGIAVHVLVSMLSPLYAMVIAVATWVAGVFWLYTAILGNPDGREDRDDGREAVLAVRGWWERWLIQSLEREDRSTDRDKSSKTDC